jgi:hypothetical protein
MGVSRLWRRSLRAGIAVPLSVVLLLLLALVHPGLALPGSSFEGKDGNLVVDTAGNTDWANAPSRVRGDDLPSGTGDNSFGQGTKEDDPAVSVVSGSIPPQKSDLTRFYVASEFANNSNYLYLAWERSNVLGSANMDFEINQKTQPNLTTTGPKTLVRTAGDLLITFDFTNGGGNPVLGLLKWVTTGSTSQCFSANALPCWGNRVNLSAAGFAEGAVNTATVSDPIAGVSLPGLTFGEASVNLTEAGVFPPGTCEAFGSAFLKSRSSASFPAEVKDFVAPRPVNISNCGTIIVKKVTEPSPDPTNTSFQYTTTGGLTPATFSLSNGGTQTYGPGTVLAGSYSVTESAPPAGWTLKKLECTATGEGTSATPDGATASITMAGGGTVECTYTNHLTLSPKISTTLSASSITVGGTVHDSATLTGATANAGGKVTYSVYDNSTCTGTPLDTDTVDVTNGVVPDSKSVAFHSAGDFYWQAVYSGDANNDGATSECTSEHLVVNKAKPSIATELSATSVSIGTTVHDSATLTGTTSNAGGTVTYTVYSNDTCTDNPQDAGTKPVTDGQVPDSDPITFNSAGDFYWQAVYSGDANNDGATSECTSEHLVVNKNQSAIRTVPNLIPNDDATLSGLTDNAGGTVVFNLYSPSDATCSGTPAYTETVNVNGNGTYSTSNTTFIAKTVGTWRWQVTYSGDANNEGSTSDCGVEHFTIDNGTF